VSFLQSESPSRDVYSGFCFVYDLLVSSLAHVRRCAAVGRQAYADPAEALTPDRESKWNMR
jgi:hypothetical protein